MFAFVFDVFLVVCIEQHPIAAILLVYFNQTCIFQYFTLLLFRLVADEIDHTTRGSLPTVFGNLGRKVGGLLRVEVG